MSPDERQSLDDDLVLLGLPAGSAPIMSAAGILDRAGPAVVVGWAGWKLAAMLAVTSMGSVGGGAALHHLLSGDPEPLVVERIVERRVEVPVERVVERRVEVPVERIVRVPEVKVVYRDAPAVPSSEIPVESGSGSSAQAALPTEAPSMGPVDLAALDRALDKATRKKEEPLQRAEDRSPDTVARSESQTPQGEGEDRKALVLKGQAAVGTTIIGQGPFDNRNLLTAGLRLQGSGAWSPFGGLYAETRLHAGETGMRVEPGLVGELGLLWQGRRVGVDVGWGIGLGSYIQKEEVAGEEPKKAGHGAVAADETHRGLELVNGPTVGLRLGEDGLARISARALSTGPDDHNVMLAAGVEIPIKNFSRSETPSR